ncbi:hypothetical protein VD659_12175 [Herbiconiux sp. 11R-BC]|uniref:hypothetical protein n=1 Tax=Herbiconiux sp. 11R-BC TaxID=3111637 RepID=UPI003C10B92B
MSTRRSSSVALLVVAAFNALSAIGGGIGLIATNGMGAPVSWLDGTAFDSYLVPGLVLLVVVGGTQLLALVLQWRHQRFALVASVVAGFGIVIWIHVEVALLPGYSFLQTLYFATGLLQLALVLVQLGVLSPAPARRG